MPRLQSIVMVDANAAWALRSVEAPNCRGADDSACVQSVCVRSTDGGRTWDERACGVEDPDEITAVDRDHAWVSKLRTTPSRPNVVIAQTSDGGATWTRSVHRADGALNAVIAFTSVSDGILSFDEDTGMSSPKGRGPYFATHDGGKTWASTSAIGWTSSRDCSTCESVLTRNNKPVPDLLRLPRGLTCGSYDAGVDSKPTIAPLTVLDLHLDEDGGGVAVATCSERMDDQSSTRTGVHPLGPEAVICLLEPGAKGWTCASRVAIGDAHLIVLRRSLIWMIGSNGALLESTDEGRTFHGHPALPFESSLAPNEAGVIDYEASFVSARVGLLQLDHLYRTDDAGASWTRLVE